MSDQPNEQPEKKIIIDEDWKRRVEAEKEALRRQQPEGPKPGEGGRQEQPSEAAGQQAEPDVPLPPPSLEVLAGSLAMQSMISMGLARDPTGEPPEVRLHQAKHFIDMIVMLEEKTEGNRTPEESRVFEDLLHELRMSYIAVQQRQQGATAPEQEGGG